MSIPTITGPPETWPIASTRCVFRGKLMDYETAAFLMAMEHELGYELTVVQGCYNPGGVDASAGTHDGGGVFDLAPWDHERKVKVARSLGGATWHREAIQNLWGEHIHSVTRKHPTLSAAAANQVTWFDKSPRHNGLAGEPVDPDQYPPRPTPTFHYPPKAPPTLTFNGVTLNDDWGNRASDVVATVAAVRPLVMGVQEGWRVDYRKKLDAAARAGRLPAGRWRVGQRMEDDSTAGVAVIWDHARLGTVGHSTRPSKLGHGWQAIGKGADTRIRGVKWQDLAFRPRLLPRLSDAMPHRFRLASVHRPPMRNRASWEDFDAALALWLKRSPLPVVLFMDSNEHIGPHPLVDDVHSSLAWTAPREGEARSIDGVLTSLPVKSSKAIPKRTSDHHAVVVTFG